MIQILADAATKPDAMISGEWLIAIIGALASAAALVIGKVQGRKESESSRDVTIKPPVPRLDVNMHEDPEFVTMEVFNGHLKRIEESFFKIEQALDSERGIARTANGNIHKRIDAMSERLGERLSKLEGTSEGIAKTTATLLDIALGKKPPTNRS